MSRINHDPPLSEQLIDQLQIALPLAQRLKVTLRQQLEDAGAVLTALEKITAIFAGILRQQRERDEARQRINDARGDRS